MWGWCGGGGDCGVWGCGDGVIGRTVVYVVWLHNY